MAYRKRRYNRRYKNKTKKFNRYAYAKTDSRNQAKQIVRLNKKINNVYKSLKPEIVKWVGKGEFKITSTSAVILPFTTLLGRSTLNDFFNGKFTKFVYDNFKFFFNSTNVDLTKGKTIRVVILQNRVGVDTAPTEADIFQETSQSIISPLKEGINNNYKILLNKNYVISSDRDYLYKSFNFKKIISYNKLTGSSTSLTFGRGSIFVIFVTTQQEEFSIRWNNTLGYASEL